MSIVLKLAKLPVLTARIARTIVATSRAASARERLTATGPKSTVIFAYRGLAYAQIADVEKQPTDRATEPLSAYSSLPQRTENGGRCVFVAGVLVRHRAQDGIKLPLFQIL